MGVIRGLKSFKDPISDVEEDPLSDMIESADDMRLALEISELEANCERRRRKSRKTRIPKGAGDVDGLSSRLLAHKGQRKQRRLQNDNQLKAMCGPDDDFDTVSIYDFIEESVSVFALMLEEMDNVALWNAMLAAEPEYVDEDHGRKAKNDKRTAHPAFTPEDCYRRLDSDMKRTLRRQRCPVDLIRSIEEQVEEFFTMSPDGVYRAKIENSFARLMLHAICEYMDLRSRSIDWKGQRWTLVKNPREKFLIPAVPLSTYLSTRRRKS